MKIIINSCYGGFGISTWALDKAGIPYDDHGIYDIDDIDRTNPKLVAIVEEDPKRASGDYAELKVVEIPDDATDWIIDEYDGYESVLYVVKGKIYGKS